MSPGIDPHILQEFASIVYGRLVKDHLYRWLTDPAAADIDLAAANWDAVFMGTGIPDDPQLKSLIVQSIVPELDRQLGRSGAGFGVMQGHVVIPQAERAKMYLERNNFELLRGVCTYVRNNLPQINDYPIIAANITALPLFNSVPVPFREPTAKMIFGELDSLRNNLPPGSVTYDPNVLTLTLNQLGHQEGRKYKKKTRRQLFSDSLLPLIYQTKRRPDRSTYNKMIGLAVEPAGPKYAKLGDSTDLLQDQLDAMFARLTKKPSPGAPSGDKPLTQEQQFFQQVVEGNKRTDDMYASVFNQLLNPTPEQAPNPEQIRAQELARSMHSQATDIVYRGLERKFSPVGGLHWSANAGFHKPDNIAEYAPVDYQQLAGVSPNTNPKIVLGLDLFKRLVFGDGVVPQSRLFNVTGRATDDIGRVDLRKTLGLIDAAAESAAQELWKLVAPVNRTNIPENMPYHGILGYIAYEIGTTQYADQMASNLKKIQSIAAHIRGAANLTGAKAADYLKDLVGDLGLAVPSNYAQVENLLSQYFSPILVGSNTRAISSAMNDIGAAIGNIVVPGQPPRAVTPYDIMERAMIVLDRAATTLPMGMSYANLFDETPNANGVLADPRNRLTYKDLNLVVGKFLPAFVASIGLTSALKKVYSP